MSTRLRRTILTMGASLMAVSLASAEPYSPSPYYAPPAYTHPAATPQITYGGAGYGQSLSSSDAQGVMTALSAARYGGVDAIRAAMAGLYDPVARKIALYVLADNASDSLSFLEADNARRDLAGWPHQDRREMAAEKLLILSGMSPQATIAWFGGGAPKTPEGAQALANALRATGQFAAAQAVVVPPSPAVVQGAEQQWHHGKAVVDALQTGNNAGAYAAAANSGLTSGAGAAEAAFYAGWIALKRLNNPRQADEQFARLQTIGQSPLTQSRALYWRGRAADAMDDPVAAQLFYGQAARYYTTFYGQLAAAKNGASRIVLERDPEINAADRARFDGREPIRAARIMAQIGAMDSFKSFVAGLSDTLPTTAEEAMLVDLARGQGDQELSMKVVRNAAKRGMILPERGYPLRTPALGFDAPEIPFVLGITRQESGFDPRARSGAGARGMMQLMPGTASVVARRLGVGYSSEELEDPDYNMRLGSAYLGQLVGQFSGSYVMAAAAYNAGPGRPTQWAAQCGDPRSSSSDPVDFIECIPFSETRDYVMRVLEATEVYRARLGGGSAPNLLATDLKRGAYGYGSHGR